MHDLTFWAVAVLAAVIAGLSKSGLLGAIGMVAVPLLTFVMPARDAAGMLLPVLLATDAIAVWIYRREADWHVLGIMLPGAALGTLAGWLLWSVVTDAEVLLFVGLITIAFTLDALLGLRKRLEGHRPSRPWGMLWGGVAGLTSFISHTGAPPYQIYALPLRLPPVVFSATTAFFFAIVNVMKIVPYAVLGQLSLSNLEIAAALIPCGFVAVVAGIWLVRRISAARFYQIAYGLIGVIGLKLVYDGIVGTFLAAPVPA